jgi:hypothetical protein
MWPLVPAVSASQSGRGTSREKVSTLLVSSCLVLASTPPALISGASVSCRLSSAGEGDLLATRVRELAAQHRLIATVTVDGRRLRATFTRLDGGPEPSDGAG